MHRRWEEKVEGWAWEMTITSQSTVAWGMWSRPCERFRLSHMCMTQWHKDIDHHVISRAADYFVGVPKVRTAMRFEPCWDVIRGKYVSDFSVIINLILIKYYKWINEYLILISFNVKFIHWIWMYTLSTTDITLKSNKRFCYSFTFFFLFLYKLYINFKVTNIFLTRK